MHKIAHNRRKSVEPIDILHGDGLFPDGEDRSHGLHPPPDTFCKLSVEHYRNWAPCGPDFVYGCVPPKESELVR